MYDLSSQAIKGEKTLSPEAGDQVYYSQPLSPQWPVSPSSTSTKRGRSKSVPSCIFPDAEERSVGEFRKSRHLSIGQTLLQGMQLPLTPPLTDEDDLSDRSQRSPRKALAQIHRNRTSILDHPVFGSALPESRPSIYEVIRSIPRQRYPIPVFNGRPTPFSLETQRRKMRWSHGRRYFLPDPEWLEPPCVDNIAEVAWPYLRDLGSAYESIAVDFLAEGGFNRVFIIHTTHQDTNEHVDYIFRVTLPVYPFYKTESDVATTEIVRHFTSIPVPTIYAYDSSSSNALGLEWILMEKVAGKKLDEAWSDLNYDQRLHLTHTSARWSAELSSITSTKIGSIYMRFSASKVDFYLGQPVDNLLSQENRLLYPALRGPFDSLEDYYDAVLTLAHQDVADLIYLFELGSLHLEPLSSKLQGTFLDQNVFYYLEGHEDWSQEDWRAEQMRELEDLLEAIQTLQQGLPQLCANAPATSSKLTTCLSHDDQSQRNIFVDDQGTPTALLDWEAVQLKPLMWFTDPPVFLHSYFKDEEPVDDSSDWEARWEAWGWSEAAKAEVRKANAANFVEKMEEYVCTKLRREYWKHLESFDCPIAKASSYSCHFLDRQLRQRILNVSASVDSHVDWTETMLEMDQNIRDDVSTDYGEDSSMED